MLADAIRLLDPEGWRDNVTFGRLMTWHETPPKAELMAAYEQRRTKWAELKSNLDATLTPAQMDAIKADIGLVDGRLDTSETEIEAVKKGTPDRNLRFHATDFIDMMVIARMAAARTTLEALQGVLVEEMTKPTV